MSILKKKPIGLLITSSFFYLCVLLSQEHVHESQKIVYSPWRQSYAIKISKENSLSTQTCPFCILTKDKEINEKNLILYRAQHNYITLATQPYIGNESIHLLIVSNYHVKELIDFPNPVAYTELNTLTRNLCVLFHKNAYEIWINTNQGKSAGASIPNHHHRHIIINHEQNCYNIIEPMQKKNHSIFLNKIYKTVAASLETSNLLTTSEPKYPLTYSFRKNCYYCAIVNNTTDKKNLIFHRGNNAIIMLSHQPTYSGEVHIIPIVHHESLKTMPTETFDEINNLAIKIYPFLLNILKVQDCNIGFVNHGRKSIHKGHFHLRIIPRNRHWHGSPIIGASINIDMKELYQTLKSASQSSKI